MREDHSTIVTKSSFKLEKPLLQLGDLRQRLFCTYDNTQWRLASIDAVNNGETHVTAPELHSVHREWRRRITPTAQVVPDSDLWSLEVLFLILSFLPKSDSWTTWYSWRRNLVQNHVSQVGKNSQSQLPSATINVHVIRSRSGSQRT